MVNLVQELGAWAWDRTVTTQGRRTSFADSMLREGPAQRATTNSKGGYRWIRRRARTPKVVVTSLCIPTFSGDVTHHGLEDNRALLADRVQEDMIHWLTHWRLGCGSRFVL
jgi:hypothetical protein